MLGGRKRRGEERREEKHRTMCVRRQEEERREEKQRTVCVRRQEEKRRETWHRADENTVDSGKNQDHDEQN